jgi:CRISPR-associated exonuclease Cas4
MDPLPLSIINDFLFCPRRAALKLIDGCRSGNEHTLIGQFKHEHADMPGYEIADGVKLLRALPVFSKRLGLFGKCDIVEQLGDGSFHPVEYKKGPRRHFDNDYAQLCAQALCLEEMLGTKISRGAVFYATSRRRCEVEFTPELRQLTETTIESAHQLRLTANLPPPVFAKKCDGCSLLQLCMPGVVSRKDMVAQYCASLFVPRTVNE